MSVGPADGATCASAPSPFADAVDDDFSATLIRQHLGGTVGNVFANDTINGAAVSAATATATITADGGATGASIGADGTLTVPAWTHFRYIHVAVPTVRGGEQLPVRRRLGRLCRDGA